jgi:hypothetical protein
LAAGTRQRTPVAGRVSAVVTPAEEVISAAIRAAAGIRAADTRAENITTKRTQSL